VRPASGRGTQAAEPTPDHIVDLRTLDGDFRARMEYLEANLLTLVLDEAGWNKTETARRLAMPVRTLAYKVKLHGLRRRDS
jgi:DNA-binding NtrC family response regulator